MYIRLQEIVIEFRGCFSKSATGRNDAAGELVCYVFYKMLPAEGFHIIKTTMVLINSKLTFPLSSSPQIVVCGELEDQQL